MRRFLSPGIWAAIICLCQSCFNPSELEICNLRCEMLEEPLAIDNTRPHFSWELRSDADGTAPSAYQVIVASLPGKLNEAEADLWNSGKVESNALVGIVYEGKPLKPRTLAYWKVRVWNQEGEASDWSVMNRFGIGILEAKDWDESAQFIGMEQPEGNVQFAPLLRQKFEYDPEKERMLLHVNSLGYHEAYVNGRPVSDAVLTPAVSQMDKRSQIVTYDVTSLMVKGRNELVLWIGRGWYQDFWGVKGGPYVRAQLDAVTPEGTRTVLTTNGNWKTAESGRHTFGSWRPHQMGGELVDERATVANLKPKTLDALEWKPAKVADIPAHKATPQMCELNRVQAELHPVEVKRGADSCFIYDMGQHFVGTTDIIMPIVDDGKQIEIYYDDIKQKKDEFRDGMYTDLYIGDGKETGLFCSKFNYKGYRYIKIKGLPEALPLEHITGYIVTTDYSGRAKFACSDKDMNQIFEMIENTLEALTFGGYMVDCPQIERLGYGGDGNASTPTAQTFFNLAPLYMNWMQAWADAQRPDGDMPHTAPNPYSAGGGPYWCGFIITASWQTYVNYGDARLLERYYPQMQKWLGFVEQHKKEGLLKQWAFTDYRNWYLGDWATPEGIDMTDTLSVDVVNNCFLADCYATMFKIARVLGKKADAIAYDKQYKELADLVHATFFDAEKKSYSTGTQIDLAYPMLVGATPEEELPAVTKTLMEETAGRFKGHLSAGLVGVPIVTQWAIENGQADFMYQMLKKREYPGYLYMIDNGATLTWEHWNGARSHIHNCYNGIGRWFIQGLVGLMPDEAEPGYKHFYVYPQLVDGITWAEAEKDTPQGPIRVRWEYEEGNLTLNVFVPVGSTASLGLPVGSDNIHISPKVPGLTLGSGEYEISCTIE